MVEQAGYKYAVGERGRKPTRREDFFDTTREDSSIPQELKYPAATARKNSLRRCLGRSLPTSPLDQNITLSL
jgi:hypothetical protein